MKKLKFNSTKMTSLEKKVLSRVCGSGEGSGNPCYSCTPDCRGVDSAMNNARSKFNSTPSMPDIF